jgi:hypothetical protein
MRKFFLRLAIFIDIEVEAKDESEATLKAIQEATRLSLYETDWEIEDIYEEEDEDE